VCPARASALASAHFGLILVLKAMRSAVDALFRLARLVSSFGAGSAGLGGARRGVEIIP
jgi:hypothetical protein